MKPTKDIFLVDLDATLLDFPKAEREALFFVLKKNALPANDGVYFSYHEINDRLWKGLERGEISREKLKVRRFELLLGEGADAEKIAKEYYGAMKEVCYPFDGAADLLKELSSRGRVYAATNGGTDIQRRHISLAGFEKYFTDVFISEEMGADKPSLKYTSLVIDRIRGFEPARALFFGDSLTSDMGCAEAMGIDFVLFAPNGIPENYRGEAVSSYREFLARLF